MQQIVATKCFMVLNCHIKTCNTLPQRIVALKIVRARHKAIFNVKKKKFLSPMNHARGKISFHTTLGQCGNIGPPENKPLHPGPNPCCSQKDI